MTNTQDTRYTVHEYLFVQKASLRAMHILPRYSTCTVETREFYMFGPVLIGLSPGLVAIRGRTRYQDCAGGPAARCFVLRVSKAGGRERFVTDRATYTLEGSPELLHVCAGWGVSWGYSSLLVLHVVHDVAHRTLRHFTLSLMTTRPNPRNPHLPYLTTRHTAHLSLYFPRPGCARRAVFFVLHRFFFQRCNPSTPSEPRPLVAGLGFLAAIFSAAIAPASISTAIATAIARLRLKVFFIFQKQQKQKETRPLHFDLVCFFSRGIKNLRA